MGIDGGKKLLPEPNKLDINKLPKSNKIYKVVIDVASIVYRYTIGSINGGTEICDRDRNKIPEIYYLVIIAVRLLSLGILPIFVFDGSAPDIKADTIKQRRKCKDDAEENLERIVNTNKENSTTDSDETMKKEFIKYKKRAYRPYIGNIQRAYILLWLMGLPVIDSPKEADPQCAAIAASYGDDVIGVITDDLDVLAYGSSNILRITSLGKDVLEEYSLQSTLNHLQEKITTIINNSSNHRLKSMYAGKKIIVGQTHLQEICCLMGNDFCPGIKLKSASTSTFTFTSENRVEQILELYAVNGMSLDRVLNSMSDSLSPVYMTRMTDSLDAYRNAKIHLPKELDLSMREPSIDLVGRICSEFLELEDAKAICNLLTLRYEATQDKKEKQIQKRNANPPDKWKPSHKRESDSRFSSPFSFNGNLWPDSPYKIPIVVS